MATPIGNPGDLSPRARDALANADMILAEDTRRAGRLLADIGIAPRQLLSFFEHNELARQRQAIAALENGKHVAIITDAGTPLLADPGFRLVRECRRQNIPVSPVPGPSAPIAALSAAGIAPLPFTFLGFLPRGQKPRRDIFRLYGGAPATLVFFERKDRVPESLALAYACLGNRQFAICRELTKTHEEFILGQLSQFAPGGEDSLDAGAAPHADDLRGEITIVIGPAAKCSRLAQDKAESIIAGLLASGRAARECAKIAKEQCNGWTSAELYDLACALKRQKTDDGI